MNDALEKLETKGLFVVSIKTQEEGKAQDDWVKTGQTKTCGNCGSLLGEKITKCSKCGKTVCVNCGNVLGWGVGKCPRCGEATILGILQGCGWSLFVIGLIMLAIAAVLIIIV